MDGFRHRTGIAFEIAGSGWHEIAVGVQPGRVGDQQMSRAMVVFLVRGEGRCNLGYELLGGQSTSVSGMQGFPSYRGRG